MVRKTTETKRREMAVNLTNLGVLRISIIVIQLEDAVGTATVVVVLATGSVGFILFVK